MSPDRKTILLMVLLSAIFWGLLETAARKSPPQISLDPSEWKCTDHEPDGCAEYRREHEHIMEWSAKR